MAMVTTEFQEKIAILRMTNGVTNAINPDLVDEMSEALVEIKAKAQGMMLCGGGKFFSMGFDLPHLLNLDRSAMGDFLRKFSHLTFDLFTIRIPTSCVLEGHAIAGGCILALTGDYRFATTEKKQIGLNEIKLGIPVPCIADMVLRQIVGDRVAMQMMYHGDFISFIHAKDIGLVDEVCPAESLEALSLERLSVIANHPNRAFSAIKANKVEEIKRRYQRNWEPTNQVFLDCWFSDLSQELLKETSKKF